MIQPRPRQRLLVQPVAMRPAAIVISPPGSPPPSSADTLLGEILARLRGYALTMRVEIAVRVANFHASTAPDLAAAWRCIEIAQIMEALLFAKGARLVGRGTADALRAEIAAQNAAAADHIAASGIKHADDAWPPRPN